LGNYGTKDRTAPNSTYEWRPKQKKRETRRVEKRGDSEGVSKIVRASFGGVNLPGVAVKKKVKVITEGLSSVVRISLEG